MKSPAILLAALVGISVLSSCGTEDVTAANSARLCKLAHNCVDEETRLAARAELKSRGIDPNSLECSKIADDAMDPRRNAPVPVIITN